MLRLCAVSGAVAVMVAAGALGCGGRSDLGISDYPPADAAVTLPDAGPPPMDADIEDAEPDVGPPDAEPDVADAEPPPPPGPLEVISVAQVPGQALRVVGLREPDPNVGELEIWSRDEETGEFVRHCEGGPATPVSLLNLQSVGGVPPPEDGRLVVQSSSCGRPPTCRQRTITLMNLDCEAIGDPVPGVVSTIPTARDGIFLLKDDGQLLHMDPVTGEVTVIATNADSVRFDGRGALWVTEGGELVRRGLDGSEQARFGANVSTFALRFTNGEVAFADEDGVRIVEPGADESVLLGSGSCRPVYANNALILLDPCEDGTLVLIDRATDERFEIATGVAAVPYALWNDQLKQVTYVLDPDARPSSSGPIASRPWPEIWVSEHPFDVHIRLATDVLIARHFGMGRVGLTRNASGNTGQLAVWTGTSTLTPIAQDVVRVDNIQPSFAALADFDGTTGRLLAVNAESLASTPVATGISQFGFSVFSPHFAYLRGFDTSTNTGTLELYNTVTGARQVVAEDVTPGFRLVFTPERALVYAVYDGVSSTVELTPFEI